jgi:hypothetical protein
MANYKTLADRQADRLKALKQKKEQARALANRPVTAKPLPNLPAMQKPSVASPITKPTKTQVERRYGRAAVQVYRDDEEQASTPALALQRVVDLYLHAAEHKSRHIAMMWPASPRSLVLVHTLATLERWADGDKQGIRGLAFPVKTNVFHPLNHLHLDRAAVLRHAIALVETSENASVKRSNPAKDAYLTSLNNSSIKALNLQPTAGELLPQFLAVPGFRRWESCEARLLANIGVRLSRRAHAKALRSNCAVIGDPTTAPDALFALDGRLSDIERMRALETLKRQGAPEVVIVNATREVRLKTKGWKGLLTKFCLLLERVFGENAPGVLVVSDEPHAAYRLKEKLWELNEKRAPDLRWPPSTGYDIIGIPSATRYDGLLPPGAPEPALPLPRELDTQIVDAEATKVINKLFQIAKETPGARETVQPVIDAAVYLTQLAALPCGVDTLMEWLGAAETAQRTRAAFSWSTHYAALAKFERAGGAGENRKALQDCMRLGEILYGNYSTATPFALLLAKYVDSIAANRKQRVLVVFTSALYRRLAQRFLEGYTDFESGQRFEALKDRVHLIPSAQLEENLDSLEQTRVVFAGLDDEGLRVLMTDNRIPGHTALLMTQRCGQYLRAVLRPLADDRFPDFKPYKPRMESILRKLVRLPDDPGILTTGDLVLPTFRAELNSQTPVVESGEDPEAWSIRLDSGAVLYRRPTHHVYVYDPIHTEASDRGFRSCEVKSIESGNKLFVMAAELREMVEIVLKDAGIPIEHDKTFEGALRDYHKNVLTKLSAVWPGGTLTDKVRVLRAAILEANPKWKSDFPAEQAVRQWVNLGQSEGTAFDKLKPQAPMKEANFAAFAAALGMSKLEAAYYWQRVIMPVRNARRLDGRHVSDIYAHMLLQPESVMVHSGIKRQTMKMLFDRARDSLATVEEVIPNTGAQSNVAK